MAVSDEVITNESCESCDVKETNEKRYLLSINDAAVTTHCQIVGEIINRLANNSNYCKTICVAVVTVLATFSNSPDWRYLIVWGIPIVVLWILDSLFVSIKKRLTKDNETYITDIYRGIPVSPFILRSPDWKIKLIETLNNMIDVSTFVFYVAMLVTLILYVLWINPSNITNVC